jgi:hypothetical protein
MNALGMVENIKETITNIFPNSYVHVKYDTNICPSIVVRFALGKDKSEWKNGIIENDNGYTIICIFDFDKEGNIPDTGLTMNSNVHGYRKDLGKLGYTHRKCGWRNAKKGISPYKMLKSIEKYFLTMQESL